MSCGGGCFRRAGVETTLISVTGKREITGSHGICFLADALFEEVNTDDADVLFLPGGMPGTNHLKAHQGLADAIRCANKQGRRLAAICAAPVFWRDGSVKGAGLPPAIPVLRICFTGFPIRSREL